MMEFVKLKAKRISKEQKQALVQHMEEHIDFAHDRFVSDHGARSLHEQWGSLASILNFIGGAVKAANAWKKAWVNMKSKSKRKVQEYKHAMGLTGNASVSIRDLTDLDERIIAVMHPVAVQGMEDVCEPAMHIESNISCFDDLEEGIELPSASGQSPRANDDSRVPLRACRPAKRRNRNNSLEQTNQKFVELEEKRLKLDERRLEVEERKLKQEKETNACRPQKSIQML